MKTPNWANQIKIADFDNTRALRYIGIVKIRPAMPFNRFKGGEDESQKLGVSGILSGYLCGVFSAIVRQKGIEN